MHFGSGEMRLLTAIEVAEILRVTEARVYELARRKLLPHIRLGRQVRFSETVLLEWVQRGGTQNAENDATVRIFSTHTNDNLGQLIRLAGNLNWEHRKHFLIEQDQPHRASQ